MSSAAVWAWIIVAVVALVIWGAISPPESGPEHTDVCKRANVSADDCGELMDIRQDMIDLGLTDG